MSRKKRKNGAPKQTGGNGAARERFDGAHRELRREPAEPRLHPDTKKSILAVSFVCIAIVLLLSKFAEAGPAGDLIRQGLDVLLGGWGYFILPATLLFAAMVFFLSKTRRFVGMTLLGAGHFLLSSLALINIFSPEQ